MKNNATHTAILVFSRSAKEEAFSKRIDMLSKDLWHYEWYKKMISHTLSVAKESHMDVFFFDEACQRGTSFGERLSYAFSELFRKGYTAVISIGNDCPTLTTSDLIHAQSILRKGKNVIGPTNKGGTYLIGMQASSFQLNSFAGLQWNSSAICCELCNYLQSIEVLSVKNDINTSSDLYDFISLGTHYLAKAFEKLIFGTLVVRFFASFISFATHYFYNKPLRAPPVAL